MTDSRSPGNGPREIAIGELLSIDVNAELRKLAEAQLEGPWLMPVELVREALARGATRVDVELGSERLIVRDDGRPFEPTLFSSITRLLDRSATAESRHAALAELDAQGARVWLALAAMPVRSLRIVADDGAAATVLAVDGDHAPQLRRGPPRPGDHGACVVSLDGFDVQPQRARERVFATCPFVSADLRVDGIATPREQVVPHRHPEYLYEAPLSAPFHGRLFVRREGEGMRVRALMHGVIATTVTLPRAPAVDVAIEMTSLVQPRATVTDLAARVESLQPLLATQAIALLLRLARSPRGDVPTSRLLAIFLAASRHASIPEFDELPLVDALDPAGASLKISVAELRRIGAEQRGVVVIDPSQPEGGISTRSVVVLLDERTRAALTERLGIVFRAPPRKARFASPSTWQRLTRAREGLIELFADAFSSHARVVPVDELTSPERAAHTLLAHSVFTPDGPIREISWRDGGGRCRLREGRLELARHDPDLRAFVQAMAADPITLYARALVLLRGHAVIGGRLRADFQDRLASRIR